MPGAAIWLKRRAENIAVALLAAMFIAFLAQILFRYVLNLPVGWPSEVTVIAWVWLVLWGAAFVLRNEEEIRFDLVYGVVGQRTRRAMTFIAALAIVALYGAALPATFDYVAFMKVQKTAYLHLRFDWLYSVYVLFAIAIIARYAWSGFRAIRPAKSPPGKERNSR